MFVIYKKSLFFTAKRKFVLSYLLHHNQRSAALNWAFIHFIFLRVNNTLRTAKTSENTVVVCMLVFLSVTALVRPLRSAFSSLKHQDRICPPPLHCFISLLYKTFKMVNFYCLHLSALFLSEFYGPFFNSVLRLKS